MTPNNNPSFLDYSIANANINGLRPWLIDALALAFHEARKNKTTTFNEHAYEVNWMENNERLADAILEHHYHPGRSIAFIVFEPVIREIFAAPFADRGIHHLICMLNGEWWDNRLINDSYSCRKNKGGTYGISRAHQMMRQATHNFTEPAMVMKFDLRGYFMSLPRKRLYATIKDGLDQQFAPYLKNPETSSIAFQIYQICKYLWREVLFDDPVSKAIRRGRPSDWDKLPPTKSLFCQPPDYGIVIGNYSSQQVSNIYLDQFDRYVKYTLGYQYYGRYVDDFFIMVPQSEYEKAKKDVKNMELFLQGMELTLHPKKRYYQSIYKGVPFLGARIYPHCLYPGNRLQGKFKRTMHRLALHDPNLSQDTIISYIGQMKNLHGDKFVKAVFTKYGLDYELYLESQSDDRRSYQEIIDDLKKSAPGAPEDPGGLLTI